MSRRGYESFWSRAQRRAEQERRNSVLARFASWISPPAAPAEKPKPSSLVRAKRVEKPALVPAPEHVRGCRTCKADEVGKCSRCHRRMCADCERTRHQHPGFCDLNARSA